MKRYNYSELSSEFLFFDSGYNTSSFFRKFLCTFQYEKFYEKL